MRIITERQAARGGDSERRLVRVNRAVANQACGAPRRWASHGDSTHQSCRAVPMRGHPNAKTGGDRQRPERQSPARWRACPGHEHLGKPFGRMLCSSEIDTSQQKPHSRVHNQQAACTSPSKDMWKADSSTLHYSSQREVPQAPIPGEEELGPQGPRATRGRGRVNNPSGAERRRRPSYRVEAAGTGENGRHDPT